MLKSFLRYLGACFLWKWSLGWRSPQSNLSVRQPATPWLSQGGRALLAAPLCGRPRSQPSSRLMKGANWNTSGELGKSCWGGNRNLSFRPKTPLPAASAPPPWCVSGNAGELAR